MLHELYELKGAGGVNELNRWLLGQKVVVPGLPHVSDATDSTDLTL